MAIEQTFTSNGSTKVFTISEFDFLRTSDIKVFIDPTGGTAKTLVTENTGAVAGQYTINQTAKTITFISSNIQGSLQTNDGSGNAGAPLAGVVTAQRITAVDTPINTFQAGSSITADDLNDSLNQLRFNINEYGTLTNSGSLSDSDKGDITVSNSGNTWTIDNSVVNNAKIANDSVDGTKLTDNIDIAGTFDVTGATTLDSTLEVTGDFSVNTNKFTVAGSDGDTTIAGTLNVTGDVTFNSNLDLQDDDLLRIGQGDDLHVFHNGTNSYIQNKTGNLVIAANKDADVGGDIWIDALNGERSIKCVHDGQVELYWNGNKKFETLTTGVSITGQVDLTTDINVNTNKFNVAGSTGNTTIAGTLTTAAQKAVTIGGPLILSKTSKDVTGLTTLALHASDNTGNNIQNATYLNLYSSSGAVSIETITGGVEGQVIIILGTGDGTYGTSTNDITLTNTTYNTGTAHGFVSGRVLDVSTGDADVFIHNGRQWINITVGNN